jgi:ferrous iron transport protein B
VILVGRPNAGKSSLFNLLTGASARVGNFAGITVDVLVHRTELEPEGTEVEIIDLPGFYALNPDSDQDSDEGIARRFLLNAAAHSPGSMVVHVVDVTQLAVSLPLLVQLRAAHPRVLLVLTQHDLLRDHGQRVDVDQLVRLTQTEAIAISSRDERDAPRLRAFLSQKMRDQTLRPAQLSLDPREIAAQCIVPHEQTAATAAKQGGYRAAARAQTKPTRSARSTSDQIDRWVLHPVLGPALFLSALALVFAAVFMVADPAASVLEAATRWIGRRLTAAIGAGQLSSFIVDGLLGGAGTVLAFLPQIVILTIALEALEASGYLARGVFLLDRFLRLVGIGGRSLVPLLMGHACAVAAIPSTRILRDPRERLLTILVLPLMTCSARIPTYSLLISAFFSALGPLKQALIFVALYFAGVVSACVSAAVLRRTVIKGRTLPLIIEMPMYRAPQRKVLLAAAARGAKQFTRDVGTTIVAASAVLWIVLNVSAPGASVTQSAREQTNGSSARVAALHRSIGARVGHALEPVSKLAGFDWRINVGLIGSFGARELMVGTMGVIMGIENAPADSSSLRARLRNARDEDGRVVYGKANAAALLVFFVLACQCMSTVAAVRRETRSWRWAAFLLAYTYTLAFAAACLVYQIGARI